MIRWPLYVRMAFGLIILFGMVGNCAGKTDGSLYVFILTAVVWTCCRIVQEGLDAYNIVRALNAYEEELKKQPPPSEEQ